jgi:hypothetical protein
MSESVRPVRLQLSRRRGFDLQALSHETNGLPAVNVARPSRWGNPFRVGEPAHWSIPCEGDRALTAEEACRLYQETCIEVYFPMPEFGCDLPTLRGRNLACWCAPDAAHCHADLLLAAANRPVCEECT